MTYAKVWGLKRSGTNFLCWLLEENFNDIEVLTEVGGWKHGFKPKEVDWTGLSWVDSERGDRRQGMNMAKNRMTPEIRDAFETGAVLDLFAVKDPYAWIDSYDRFAHTHFKQDIRTPEEMCRIWNNFNRHWMEAGCRWVKSDEMVIDPVPWLNGFHAYSGATKKHDEWKTTANRMARRADTNKHLGRETKKPFDPTRYTEKKYLDKFRDNRALLACVNRRLDRSLMEIFGYEIWSG